MSVNTHGLGSKAQCGPEFASQDCLPSHELFLGCRWREGENESTDVSAVQCRESTRSPGEGQLRSVHRGHCDMPERVRCGVLNFFLFQSRQEEGKWALYHMKGDSRGGLFGLKRPHAFFAFKTLKYGC